MKGQPMGNFTGFYGIAGGAVQSTYDDQPGVGVPGELAYASDINFCDALCVGDANGIAAGLGVKRVSISSDDAVSLQTPLDAVFLPGNTAGASWGVNGSAGGETIASFAAVMIFDETMQSDSSGQPGWDTGRMAMVARPERGGARPYVKCVEACTKGNNVYWITVGGAAASGAVYAAGQFASYSPGGGVTAVELTNAFFITSGVAGGVAMIEYPLSYAG